MKSKKGLIAIVLSCLILGAALFYAGLMTGLRIANSEKNQTETLVDKKQTPKKETKPATKTKEDGKIVSGKLHVDGNHLVDGDGNVVQLRGVSTHGLSWFPQYVNPETLKTIHDDWGANVFRLAMYTAEYNGYCSGGDKESLKNTIRNGIKYATDLKMYVIVDWHILSDCNPMQNKEEAKNFFREISKEYKDNPYVIYEICNEPQNSPWSSVIKPYCEEVIQVIRENTKDAIILCGTNTWSQDIHEVVNDRINDENVMYVMHFYAGTHKDDLRNRMKNALDANLPVFVSECSIVDASGNGNIDYDSANKWLDLMNKYKVSFLAWSLCNKNESSALLSPETEKLSGWNDGELSETGRFFKKAISGK